MTKAIRIHGKGGPEILKWEDIEVGKPGKGEIRIKQNACGLNYIDVYFRTGLYPIPSYPAVIGMEAAGVVEDIGDGVSEFKIGDRVTYPMVPGAYAEARCMPTLKVVRIPDGIDDKTAAAMMLKGMTAHYLLHRTYPVKKGDPILVYAAAGGVGLILCQWAKLLGATVIGCVGSEEKAEIAKAHGCDHPILYRTENIAARVKEITDGKGAAVAYDSIGKATFEASLDSLRPFGMMVTYGNASGPVDPVNLGILGPKGSLYVTRPTLGTHTATRELVLDGANALFDVVKSGKVKIEINQTYALKDAAQAHRDLEARETTGSTVFTV
ncbi:MAG: quinone oxidoreductase [Proteobacteria bacterium]|nr:quinone oxidoreductase [Pseudomonadota bacterium]